MTGFIDTKRWVRGLHYLLDQTDVAGAVRHRVFLSPPEISVGCRTLEQRFNCAAKQFLFSKYYSYQ